MSCYWGHIVSVWGALRIGLCNVDIRKKNSIPTNFIRTNPIWLKEVFDVLDFCSNTSQMFVGRVRCLRLLFEQRQGVIDVKNFIKIHKCSNVCRVKCVYWKSLSCLFARIHMLLRLRSRLRQFHLDKIKLDLKRKTLRGIFWRKFVKKVI